MKSLKYLIIFSFLIMGAARKAPVIAPSPTPAQSTAQVNSSVDHFSYVCKSCTANEKLSIIKMEALLNKIVFDQCFDDAWKSFKRIEQAEIGGKKLNAQSIIDSFRSAKLEPIPLVFYTPGVFQSKRVIGYTIPGEPEIYLNRNFRYSSSWTTYSEASNILHETAHKIGYAHDFNATERRPYSVPYLSNRVAEYCESKGVK